jgi:hypothetical protein
MDSAGLRKRPKEAKGSCGYEAISRFEQSEPLKHTVPYRVIARMLEKGFLYCVDDEMFLHSL